MAEMLHCIETEAEGSGQCRGDGRGGGYPMYAIDIAIANVNANAIAMLCLLLLLLPQLLMPSACTIITIASPYLSSPYNPLCLHLRIFVTNPKYLLRNYPVFPKYQTCPFFICRFFLPTLHFIRCFKRGKQMYLYLIT
ncbi:hypothetical protein VNO77_20035 [Canavalia gladiata]|uniref:Uncharacterized protein n=1 Tax=Canavalia gladiata TaxID=3824 RepID=A0AAN9LNQ0_CANGL